MDIDLTDLQGLVRSGYGRLRAARFVLLRVSDAAAARKWLAALPVTSASARLAAGPPGRPTTALNIAFTAPGLTALGVDAALLDGFSREFREGMDTPHRARLLGDEGPSARETWRWGRGDQPVHALLMLYGERDVAALYDEQRRLYLGACEEVVPLIETRMLTLDPDADDSRSLEHFGFRDGVSQPRLPIDEPGVGADSGDATPLAMGEFALGYPNEYEEIAAGPILPASVDPGDILPRVDGTGGADLGRNGSYLVARQLVQYVREFWQFLHEAGGGVAAAREEMAAKMIGRRRDGRPLIEGRGLNGFGFFDDPIGARCPIGAHVRRSNPRDWIPGQTKVERAIKQTRHHRLLRRGRSYGPPLHPKWDIDAIVRGEGTDAERGLVFMCLVADIGRQFEFVQSSWVMSPKFGGLESGADPVVGPRPRTMTIRGDSGRRLLRGLPRFVDLRGGAYFFLPGIKALRWLAAH